MNIQVNINQKSIDDINHIGNVLEELYQQLLYMADPVISDENPDSLNPYPVSIGGVDISYLDIDNKSGKDKRDGNVKACFKQLEYPVNIQKEELPVLFFGLGETKENNSLTKPVNYRAETSTILINALLGGFDEDETLLENATNMQTAIRMLVKGNQDLGNTISEEQAKVKSETIVDGVKIKVFNPSTKQVRLARTLPFRQRSRSQVSKRLLLIFHVEVDYIYSML